MKTINKIRSKDPDIYDNEKEWFDRGEDEEGDGGEFVWCTAGVDDCAQRERVPFRVLQSRPISLWLFLLALFFFGGAGLYHLSAFD